MDQHLVIVMEYAKGGQLLDLVIQSAAGHFLEHEARYFFQQLVGAVEYCHNQVWRGFFARGGGGVLFYVPEVYLSLLMTERASC